jgi:hypothetical protein
MRGGEKQPASLLSGSLSAFTGLVATLADGRAQGMAGQWLAASGTAAHACPFHALANTPPGFDQDHKAGRAL